MGTVMRRETELDAVRGIAALIVMFFHFWLIVPDGWKTHAYVTHMMGVSLTPEMLFHFTPLRLLVSGSGAVGLFFVLSGYVLSLSVARQRMTSYGRFIVRRIFRIYLPFAIVVLFSAALLPLVKTAPLHGVSDWFANEPWSVYPTEQVVAGHLLMIGTIPLISLDNPMWSLIIEMRVSLIFPILFILMEKYRNETLACVTAAYFCSSIFLNRLGENPPTTFMHSVIFTFEYLPLFVVGILFYQFRDRISGFYGSTRPVIRNVIMPLAVLLLGTPTIGPENAVGIMKNLIWIVCTTIGSVSMICIAINNEKIRSFLQKSHMQGLGHISYSLYLSHMVVLLVMAYTLLDHMSLWRWGALSLPVCVMVAAVCFWFVESPCMRAGYWLTRRRYLKPELAGLSGWSNAGKFANHE
ncbi:acyltransferase [Gluconacetobacter entanii]|uniref:Acyltransferase n=3 Tax=Gluconacetobacter entanii TaxID=108528 RepID=A0A318PPG4_9PROT|nr:acyltransferase [Gluconacetobacter entanii]